MWKATVVSSFLISAQLAPFSRLWSEASNVPLNHLPSVNCGNTGWVRLSPAPWKKMICSTCLHASLYLTRCLTGCNLFCMPAHTCSCHSFPYASEAPNECLTPSQIVVTFCFSFLPLSRWHESRYHTNGQLETGHITALQGYSQLSVNKNRNKKQTKYPKRDEK